MFTIFKVHFILFSHLLFLTACGGGNDNPPEEGITNHNLPTDGKPGTVANVTAVAGNGNVTINWQAPTTGGKVDYYVVDKSIDNKKSFTTVYSKISGDITTATDPNALNGKRHIYSITAGNNINTGDVAYSNTVMPKAKITAIKVTAIIPDLSLIAPNSTVGTSIYSSFGKSIAYHPDGLLMAVTEHTTNQRNTNINVVLLDKLQFVTGATTPWNLKQTIITKIDSLQSQFGTPIAFSPNGFSLAIAASHATVNGVNNAGLVEIYSKSTSTGIWELSDTLTAPTGVDGILFGSSLAFRSDGFSLAISGVIPGATLNEDVGAVYVFNILKAAMVAINPWTLNQTLTSPDATLGQYFGIAIAFSPDDRTLAIGETRASLTNPGNVYLYTRPTFKWEPAQALVSATPSESQLFGNSISFSSDSKTLAIAETKDTSFKKPNTVQLFTKATVSWVTGQTITATTPGAINGFAIVVAFSPKSNLLAISDIYTSSVVADAGQVLMYDKFGTDWNRIKVLISQRPVAGNFFGANISFSPNGRFISIGEPKGGLSGSGSSPGLVNIFDSFKFK